MSEDMIERVARAIKTAYECQACGALVSVNGDYRECCTRSSWTHAEPRNQARAAIEAMREPTPRMVRDGELRLAWPDVESPEDDVRGIWNAMLDAAPTPQSLADPLADPKIPASETPAK